MYPYLGIVSYASLNPPLEVPQVQGPTREQVAAFDGLFAPEPRAVDSTLTSIGRSLISTIKYVPQQVWRLCVAHPRLTILVLTSGVAIVALRAYVREIATRYLAIAGEAPRIDQVHIRNTFGQTPNSEFRQSKTFHTHPDSAQARTNASETMRTIAENVGLKAFFYQRSAADVRHGKLGSRIYYWIKDITTGYAPFNPGNDNVIVMVDTDFYVDMPKFIANTFSPYLIRTLQPKVVGFNGQEISFCFNQYGEIDYRVAGGATFKHALWNYQTDNLMCTTWHYGFYPVTTCYLVERRPNGPHHDIVLLAPLRRYSGFAALIANAFLQGGSLTRFSPKDGEFNIIQTRGSQNDHRISIGMPGEFTSANISIDTYTTALNVARALKTDITPASVESLLDMEDKVAAKLVAALVTRHARHRLGPHPFFVFPIEEGVRNYQYGTYDPDAKPTLTAFMTPIIHGAYAPDASLGNEKRAIKARITNVAVKDTPPTPFMLTTFREFSERLIPHPHAGVPVWYDEVEERQPTRSQQAILNEAQGWTRGFRDMISSFIKREAYQTPNDPRVISTVNPRTKLDYSCFIYSFADNILTFRPWYAFSQPPVKIAERVCYILSKASTAAETDFSRFDGRVDGKARLLEKMLLLRYFHPRFHNDVLEVHSKTFNLPGVGRFGTRYDTGTARNSGESATSAFNTIINAYTMFLAWRMEKHPITGTFYDADQAWHRLEHGFIAGGDDGLTADAPTTLIKAASLLGHVLEVKTHQRGNSGVMFLARVFGPDVWTGDPRSICDLHRQLSKFHTTPNLPDNVTPAQKLYAKALSFYHTDHDTPIIGEWCKRIIETAAAEGVTKVTSVNIVDRWWDNYDQSVQFPNGGEWTLAQALSGEMAFFNYDLFKRWLERIDEAPSMYKLLRPPLFVPVVNEPPKEDAVISGELVRVPPSIQLVPKQEKAAPKKVRFAKETKPAKNVAPKTKGKGPATTHKKRGSGD